MGGAGTVQNGEAGKLRSGLKTEPRGGAVTHGLAQLHGGLLALAVHQHEELPAGVHLQNKPRVPGGSDTPAAPPSGRARPRAASPDLVEPPHEADGPADVLRQLGGGDAVPRRLMRVLHHGGGSPLTMAAAPSRPSPLATGKRGGRGELWPIGWPRCSDVSGRAGVARGDSARRKWRRRPGRWVTAGRGGGGGRLVFLVPFGFKSDKNKYSD